MALTKALKSGASATPRTVAQPPTEGPQTAEEIAAAVRAQADAGDSGRSSAEDAARPGAEGEAGQGGALDAARPGAGDNAGRGGAQNM